MPLLSRIMSTARPLQTALFCLGVITLVHAGVFTPASAGTSDYRCQGEIALGARQDTPPSTAPSALTTIPNFVNAAPAAQKIYIEELDLGYMSQGFGNSNKRSSSSGNAITLGGKQHEHGVGTHAPGEFSVDLKGCALKFDALCGIDDETKGKGAAKFQVWVDGRKKYDSGVLHGGDQPKMISVDLRGAQHLLLAIADTVEGADFAHADWADAAIIFDAASMVRPTATTLPEHSQPSIAPANNSKLAVNEPRVSGATPGRPFLFRIPATGEGKLSFSAAGLPEGLKLDENTGIISGSLKKDGESAVELTVKNLRGTVTSKLTIVAGHHKLAQTPPMGWNSWNVWAATVDAEKIRAAADWLVKTGLANHGYQYINIDDGWEGKRDEKGIMHTNEKFGDMKALADYVHCKGLKLGIYSSPGPKTCQGLAGSYQHEAKDAQTYAAWGIDYLKYDLCSYKELLKDQSVEELKKPYEIMGQALDGVDRDMVYSLCQYGLGDVWKWGTSIGGNLWRTTGDIGDKWGTITRLGFGEASLEKYAGPGHWNDPDMLVVGKLGQGWGARIHPTELNHHEQVTHITLWSMLAAPLLIGCDLSQLDTFTINLLSNDEVIAVDQDPLGKEAGPRIVKGLTEIWTRQLADGATAVALFNRSPQPERISVNWTDLGLRSHGRVRDLWQRKDLGVVKGVSFYDVPAHGAVLLRVGHQQ